MNWYVLVAALLASIVEFVEALTIVLAVGTVEGWRPAMRGTLLAILSLSVLTGILGIGVLHYVPINVLRGVIGVLLLLFGIKWLRKAILRFAGKKSLHNETEAYQKQLGSLQANKGNTFAAQATAFNGVFLEGLEVVVIVLTMGSAAQAYPSAIVGSAIGLVLVLVAGVMLRAPLAKVPENVMKFVVGTMLTSFGSFWAGESLGVLWPGQDLSIVLLIAGYLAVSGLLVASLKKRPSARKEAAS
ncbi:COG4280 domain-containing protein [Sulfobacillus harzensis]|uniref:GDT1 family protein n=1 Tax=Sulfobacillus harzensis TaxID=2729629 RepID=A0A7Y0Q3A2_9FIRM|nr:hypothetical protein [Sulfobacillus harzensis]NMP23180.1 hypothetical protein [Sulfobacillus harzensis]